MQDELVDILNNKGDLIGKTISRNIAHEKGIWHATAHIWIYTPKGQVLIQKRSAQSFVYPSLWDISVAGHVPAGESVKEAAVREVYEEIGVKIEKADLKLQKVVKQSYKLSDKPHFLNNEFNYLYTLKFKGKISDLNLKKDEVGRVKFLSLEDFTKEIFDKRKFKKFVPHNYYPLIIEAIRKELYTTINARLLRKRLIVK